MIEYDRTKELERAEMLKRALAISASWPGSEAQQIARERAELAFTMRAPTPGENFRALSDRSVNADIMDVMLEDMGRR